MPRDAVALAHRRNAQRSECPYSRHMHVGRAATESRPFGAHRSNAQQAESPRGSHADVKAVHKRKASCSQSREKSAPPASVPKGFKSPAHPRPASLRRRRSPTKSTALRVPSTPTYPHTRPTSSPTPTRFIVETPTAKPNRGERILPRNAPSARAHTVPRPICPYSAYMTSYSNTPTPKSNPRHFSPQNRRPPAPLGYA